MESPSGNDHQHQSAAQHEVVPRPPAYHLPNNQETSSSSSTGQPHQAAQHLHYGYPQPAPGYPAAPPSYSYATGNAIVSSMSPIATETPLSSPPHSYKVWSIINMIFSILLSWIALIFSIRALLCSNHVIGYNQCGQAHTAQLYSNAARRLNILATIFNFIGSLTVGLLVWRYAFLYSY